MNFLSKLPNPMRLLSVGALIWLLAACVVPATPAAESERMPTDASNNCGADRVGRRVFVRLPNRSRGRIGTLFRKPRLH